MRVRMRVKVSGTRAGKAWPEPGGELELPDAEGAKLCAAGMAEPVAASEPVETATSPTAEVATTLEPEKPTRPAAEKRGRGRPKLPRDSGGNIIRE